jgi:CheY-like chemotaxis protein
LPDSGRKTVLLVGQNLFFLGRVEVLTGVLGYEVLRASTESAFWDIFASRQPALILVDLEGDELVWGRVLEGIQRAETRAAKIVAFGPHENVAVLQRAKNQGCDLVLNKGEFNRDLPKILQGLV